MVERSGMSRWSVRFWRRRRDWGSGRSSAENILRWMSGSSGCRATALLAHMPAGQVIITSAGGLPTAARPDRILRIARGTIVNDEPADTANGDPR